MTVKRPLLKPYLAAALLVISPLSISGEFQETVILEDHHLKLCNSSRVKVMGFFNVGSAALYLEDCVRTSDRLNQPIQLSIIYQRDISAQDFQESAYTLLQKNLERSEFSNIENELNRFNSYYQNMTDGDRYDIGYSEKTGLLLHKNGTLISQSQSSELGKTYFRIWFGERPFSKSLKKSLLSPID